MGHSRLGEASWRSSNVRNAPLATVGLKKAACREGPERDLGGAIAHLQSMRSLAVLAATQLPHAHRDDLDRELYRVAETVEQQRRAATPGAG